MPIAMQGTVTTFETDTGTNAVITYPSGITAGELLLVHVMVSTNAVLTTPPSGWAFYKSSAGGSATSGPSATIYYRVAAGTEAGTVTFPGQSTAGRITAYLTRWTGVNTTTPFDTAAVEGPRVFATTVTVPSITTVTPAAVLIHQLGISSTSSFDIDTHAGTTKLAGSTGVGRRHSIFREDRPTAGATGTKTWTHSSANTTTLQEWSSLVVALRPGDGTTPPPVAPTPFRKGTPVVYENASATNVTMYHPSGIAAGELLTAHITHSAPNAPTTNPGGWVLAATRNAANTGSATEPSSSIWYKIASGFESGTVTFPTSGVAGRVTGVMHRWGSIDAANPVDATPSTAAQAGSFSFIASPGVTTTVDNALLIHHVVANTNNTADITAPPEVTKVSGTTGTGRRQSIYTEVKATAGTSSERTFTLSPATPTLAMHSIVLPLRGGTSGAGGNGTGGGETGGGGNNLDPVGPQPGSAPTISQRIVGIPAEPKTNGVVQAKVSGATSVRLKVSTDAAGTLGVVYGPTFTPSSLGDVRLTVAGLAPNTRYYYRLLMTNSSGGQFLDTLADIGRLRTAPNGPASFAFCFASCCVTSDPDTFVTIANRVNNDGDAFFLHIGDFQYADGSGTGIENFRTRYNNRIRGANHQKMLHQTPFSYTPSDHDAMNNNGAAGDDPTAWANWNTMRTELFPMPHSYYSWAWGRVRFIQLDTRSYRTSINATDNSSKTALGATQKQWLKDQITNMTEAVAVIIQDVPWIHPIEAGDDSWGGVNTERTELGNFFAASGKNICMLAGDMHAVAADDGRNSAGGIAVFHAAPLENASSQKGGPYSAGLYPSSGSTQVKQYGRIVVTDTGTTAITLAFQGLSSSNTVRISLSKAYPAPLAGIANVAAPAIITSTDLPAPTIATSAAPVGVGAIRAQATSRALAPVIAASFAPTVLAPRAQVNVASIPLLATSGIAVNSVPARATAAALAPEVTAVALSTIAVPSAGVSAAAIPLSAAGYYVALVEGITATAQAAAIPLTAVGQRSAATQAPVAVVVVTTAAGTQVEGVIAGSITAPRATGSVRALPPLFGAGVLISIPAARASALVLKDDMFINAGWTTSVPVAAGTVAALPPLASVGSTVESLNAHILAQAVSPTIQGSSTIVVNPPTPISGQAYSAVITGTVIIVPFTALASAAAYAPVLTYGSDMQVPAASVVAQAVSPFAQGSGAVDISSPVAAVAVASPALGYATNMPLARVARVYTQPGGPIVEASSVVEVSTAAVSVAGGNMIANSSVHMDVLSALVVAVAHANISFEGSANIAALAARVWIKANDVRLPGTRPWKVRWPRGVNLEAYDEYLVEMAEKAAGDTLRMLTLYRVGGLPLTVMPCTDTCAHPFTGGQFGNSYLPFYPVLLDSGKYANCFCKKNCECESSSTVLLTEPVGYIATVRIDGEVLDPSAYHVDDGYKLVRHDGGAWPACAGPNFTVTYLNAYEVDSYGEYAAGVLALEYLKLFTTPNECRLPRTVANLSRGGMQYEVTVDMYPDGLTQIPEVDPYIVRWNPHGLKAKPGVYSPDVKPQHRRTEG